MFPKVFIVAVFAIIVSACGKSAGERERDQYARAVDGSTVAVDEQNALTRLINDEGLAQISWSPERLDQYSGRLDKYDRLNQALYNSASANDVNDNLAFTALARRRVTAIRMVHAAGLPPLPAPAPVTTGLASDPLFNTPNFDRSFDRRFGTPRYDGSKRLILTITGELMNAYDRLAEQINAKGQPTELWTIEQLDQTVVELDRLDLIRETFVKTSVAENLDSKLREGLPSNDAWRKGIALLRQAKLNPDLAPPTRAPAGVTNRLRI